MHRFIIITVIAAALLIFIYSDRLGPDLATQAADAQVVISDATVPENESTMPERAVLDITVHTVEELQILLDRAEILAESSHAGEQDAGLVLVLHGPEVEFFSTRNYTLYKEIVDQAARLDTLDIVDVKICQTMMAEQGVARDDIPEFIEQVPDGQVEVDRLVREGYVYF